MKRPPRKRGPFFVSHNFDETPVLDYAKSMKVLNDSLSVTAMIHVLNHQVMCVMNLEAE